MAVVHSFKSFIIDKWHYNKFWNCSFSAVEKYVYAKYELRREWTWRLISIWTFSNVFENAAFFMHQND